MNQLKMDLQQTIGTLSRSGWSQRRIARELGIDRETVARYRRLAREVGEPKPAIAPPGSEATTAPSDPPTATAKPAIPPAGSEPAKGANPAISPTGSKPGRVSHCEPFERFIQGGLDAGLSAQRIYQDLVRECERRRESGGKPPV